MNRLFLQTSALMASFFVAGAIYLTACTPTQNAGVITIASNALACYNAVAAFSAAGTLPVQVLTAATVAVLDPSCAALTAATQELIASAINSKTPVQVGPVSAPAGGPVPAARR